jgi:hypothetical protein
MRERREKNPSSPRATMGNGSGEEGGEKLALSPHAQAPQHSDPHWNFLSAQPRNSSVGAAQMPPTALSLTVSMGELPHWKF